jgi:hypothetical protein
VEVEISKGAEWVRERVARGLWCRLRCSESCGWSNNWGSSLIGSQIHELRRGE